MKQYSEIAPRPSGSALSLGRGVKSLMKILRSLELSVSMVNTSSQKTWETLNFICHSIFHNPSRRKTQAPFARIPSCLIFAPDIYTPDEIPRPHPRALRRDSRYGKTRRRSDRGRESPLLRRRYHWQLHGRIRRHRKRLSSRRRSDRGDDPGRRRHRDPGTIAGDLHFSTSAGSASDRHAARRRNQSGLHQYRSPRLSTMVRATRDQDT